MGLINHPEWGYHLASQRKKTVVQAYFKPLRAKVSSHPASRQSIKGCAVFRVSLTAGSAVSLWGAPQSKCFIFISYQVVCASGPWTGFFNVSVYTSPGKIRDGEKFSNTFQFEQGWKCHRRNTEYCWNGAASLCNDYQPACKLRYSECDGK